MGFYICCKKVTTNYVYSELVLIAETKTKKNVCLQGKVLSHLDRSSWHILSQIKMTHVGRV